MEQMALDLGDSEEENRKKRIADAKAKVKELAEEHRATAKDERTYKRFGEPVTRGGGGGGAMPKSNRDITKNYKVGGKVSSASSRADGCAIRGKTKGRMV